MCTDSTIYNIQKKEAQKGLNLYFSGKLGGDESNNWEQWSQYIGNLCEMLADIIFTEEKKAQILTLNRITDVSETGHKGLDIVAQTKTSYIIGDVKYGASKLAEKQMSKEYSLGYRLDDAVGHTIAETIRHADKQGAVQYLLIHFTEDGFSKESIAVQVYRLDNNAHISVDADGNEIYETIVYGLS